MKRRAGFGIIVDEGVSSDLGYTSGRKGLLKLSGDVHHRGSVDLMCLFPADRP
jgi:hypothetical protein